MNDRSIGEQARALADRLRDSLVAMQLEQELAGWWQIIQAKRGSRR